ncbi:phage tail tape measure protein [Bacillus sp. 005/A4HT-01/001]|uniref:phage tail tape measure protein n=1 Tax=Bacillus sp. 005/A4HT-01/001 TaxID=2509010 RepID=UPI0010750559|nr:phage tail tape measure protein [Bacillus sp. 005/A4HT-01/001]TFW48972.1 phage tail tape measure protein [Bacillus sp. 005/A4HT-01/001]
MSAVSVGEIVARLELESSQFTAGVAQAQAQMQQMGNSAKSLSTQMGLIQTAALAVGGAVVAGIGVSVKTAADFEQAMSKVQSISGATGQDFQDLQNIAMKLGESTKYTATEAAQGLQYLAMAGFSVKDQIGSLPAVLNMAAAASVDMGTSADIVSNIMTGFGIASEDSTYAVDVLVKTMTSANTDLLQLGDAMKFVAPVATSLGFTFEETAAAVAKMSDAGIQGSMAGTALRAGLLRLANPVGRAAKAMHAYGIEVEQADGKMKPIPEIIGHLNEKLGHLGKAQKTAAVASLVGTEAASGFAALLSAGEGTLKSYTKSLEESGGTADRVAKTQMDNLKGSFEEFTSALEGVGIKLGNEFLPHIRSIVDQGTKLVGLFSQINPSVTATGLAMAGTSVAIALTAASVVKLGFALRGLFAAMGPAGWIITGLSVLGGLLVGVSAGYKALNTVSLEAANAKQKEVDGINKMIKEYDGLQAKMKLTNDELLRYLDNKDALANEKDSAAIKKLNAEQDGLRKSSGLTNEEFDRFLQLNDQIIKKSPETEAAFSAQGNAIAKNTEAMKAYSKEKYEELSIELEKQATIAERNEDQNLAKVTELQTGINKLKRERNDLEDDLAKQKSLILQKEMELQSAEKEGNAGKISMAQHEVELEKFNLKKKQDQYAEILKQIQAKNKSLGETQKELGKLDQVKQKQVDLALQQVGLNAKKGQGVAVLDKEIMKLKDARANLVNNTTEADKKTAEYRESLAAIEKELSQLDQTKNKVIDITSQAEKMNNALGKDLSKYITIFTNDVTRKTERAVSRGRGNEGTYHVGGIVGKPAGKLHSGGMASKFGNPMSREVDIRALRNEMVLTEAQQANLFRMVDAGHTARIGNGAPFASSEVTRLLQSMDSTLKAKGSAAVIMDSEVVGRLVEPHVSRRQMDEIDRSSY